MNSRDFCYWLQGYFEVAGPGPMTEEQVECVKRHLSLVFIHEIDPSFGPADKQKPLDEAHSPAHPIATTATWHGPPKMRC